MASSIFDLISPKLLRFMKIIAKMTTMAIFLNPASRNIAPGKLSMVWRSELHAYITSAEGQFLMMFQYSIYADIVGGSEKAQKCADVI